jgi:mannitol-1-phosphate 5-dehydrogenase
MVLFGAGKIGRSFIGQLFSQGGYEVVFVDIFKPVIDALNERGNYNVIIKSDIDKIQSIKNVRGILVNDHQTVIAEIASAEILAVSIGQKGLPYIMPLLAKGLLKRFEQNPESPLDIIIAENLRNAAEYFEEELTKLLPVTYPLKNLVGLVETSIGKMVPIMLKKDMDEDILQVFAEPYNTLILDKKAFKNPIPDVKGLAPKENMKAWVDRKLFIHNLGHAATAYLGHKYNNRFIYLYEALAVPEIYKQVRDTMLQAADVLLIKYPDEFTVVSLTEHIDDLLYRFQNRALGDTIFRVGCDLFRKLGPEDRIVGVIKLAKELNMPFDKILNVLLCSFEFRATDELGQMYPADIEFVDMYQKGIDVVLRDVCELEI